MARKSLGHTTLFWFCPNCDTRNPGPKKTCTTCGNPQPEDVEFIQGDEELLRAQKTDPVKGKSGADIHCPFCGTRNRAAAEICTQCGGKLTGGKRRASGRVVGAYKGTSGKGKICPSCGHQNKPNAPRCEKCGSSLVQREPKPKDEGQKKDTKVLWMVIGFVIVIVMVFVFIKGCSRSTEMGIVSRAAWTRTIAIEQLIPTTREDWWDEIPAEAYITACEERFRTTSDEYIEGAIEVCGTPYTIDEGTGEGEVVQDCEYEVYDSYCEYEISDWEVVEIIETEGTSMSASWPAISVFSDQREGERTETYTIWFETDEGQVKFETDDFNLFLSAQHGSEWELAFDGFGNIRSAEPR